MYAAAFMCWHGRRVVVVVVVVEERLSTTEGR